MKGGAASAVAWAALAATAACGRPASAPGGIAGTTLTDAVDRLRAGGRIDRAQIERMLGTRLVREDGNKAFAFHTAAGVRLADAVVSVDLREPVPGGGATAGALLTLRVERGCPSRRGIEARYGPLALTQSPHGHSRDETTGLSREQPWGRLTFGFADRSPGCLAAVTFMAKRQDA